MTILATRALKVTCVLDPKEVATLADPSAARVSLRIQIAGSGRIVTADIAAKAVRKAQAAIAEHGPDGVAVLIQGKLVGETITEAGLVAQAKVKPVENATV